MRTFLYLIILCLFFLLSPHVSAQMMGTFGTPSITPTQEDLQDIKGGQDLYTKFQNKQVSCTSLTDADFEKKSENT